MRSPAYSFQGGQFEAADLGRVEIDVYDAEFFEDRSDSDEAKAKAAARIVTGR